MSEPLKARKTTHYQLSRYPENCAECPAFTTHSYQCMNECGQEGHCDLGYIDGDARDFTGRSLWPTCQIKNSLQVTINSHMR